MLRIKLIEPIVLRLKCYRCGHEFTETITHMNIGWHEFSTRCPRCKRRIYMDRDPVEGYFMSEQASVRLISGIDIEHIWKKLSESEKHGIRFGLFPASLSHLTRKELLTLMEKAKEVYESL